MMLEINKIYQGDCLELMKELPNNSIDLILTDIPYGEVNRKSNGLAKLDFGDADIVNFNIDYLIKELIRICKGSIYIFCGIEQISKLRSEMVKSQLSTRVIIWEKTNPVPTNGEYIYLSGIELCCYGKKSKATFNSFCKNTIFRHKIPYNQKHPTQKPIALFREFIKISSNENDLVLDCFMGSGTTAVACKQLNRRYIGIELNQQYVDITNKRLNQSNLLTDFKEEE